MPRSLAVVIAITCICASTLAQNELPGENDWYPLGGIEAEGLVATIDKDTGIEVKGLVDGGLAEKGGLQVGDLIISAEGKKLDGKTDDEFVDRFCALVEKAESKKAKDGQLAPLDLVIVRAGKKEKLSLGVHAYPPFHKSDISKCKKTEEILAAALDFLAADQKEDGRPGLVANENHAVATASLSGLAWLGSGNQKYARNIESAAAFVAKQAGKESDFGRMGKASGGKEANWNQTNWALGYGAIFLAEYVARDPEQAQSAPAAGAPTPDGDGDAQEKAGTDLRSRLAEMVKQLEANQERSGGWAHGPGGPNALGYVELEIMSNFALGGMGMAERVGVELDRNKVLRGYEWIKACTSGGGVAYSPLPGQAGNGDPGRTAGALWALIQVGRSGDLTASMSKYYSRGLEKLYEGHACPTMHLLNGGLASAIAGKKSFADYWKVYRPFLMTLRTAKGAFGYRPTTESRSMKHHPDRSWGPAFATAHAALIMELAQDRFEILDTPRPAN